MVKHSIVSERIQKKTAPTPPVTEHYKWTKTGVEGGP